MSREVRLTRIYRFNAGHRLYDPARDDAWNREIYGKCSNAGGHGHNYRLEVTVSGIPDPDTGWVISPAELDEQVDREVLEPLDHRNLNEVLDLDLAAAPTSEVLGVEIWRRLAPCLPERAPLYRIVLHETEKNLFEYYGGAGLNRRQ